MRLQCFTSAQWGISSHHKCTTAPARRRFRTREPLAVAAAAASGSAPPSSPPSSYPVTMKPLEMNDSGPPRFVSPLIVPMPAAEREELPLLIYLPGVDGTGLAASRQFPPLLTGFDLRAFVTPSDDRTPFLQQVQLVKEYLQQEVPQHPPTRPVYILGESFGGVLALAAAAECPELVDRVILVNPATSYPRSLWPILGPLLPQVPQEFYPLLPLALAPVLGNPVNLLAAGVEGSGSVREQAQKLVSTALGLLRQLPRLADILPPDTLSWKLDLLAQGSAAVAPLLPQVQQRVLVLVGDGDALIPSGEEGPRLQRALPRAHLRVLKGRSHALLQEGGVDLLTILNEEGFYTSRRRMSAPVTRRGKGGFGAAAPIELPTEGELKRYAERTTRVLRQLSSPVFISTSPEGRRALGLSHIPSGRPLLLVGNHQTLAIDLGPLCEQFLAEKGTLIRGLAHPIIFQQGGGSGGEAESVTGNNNGNGSFPAASGTQNGAPRKSVRSGGEGGAPGLAPWDTISTASAFLSGQGPQLGGAAGGSGGGEGGRGGRGGGATDGRSSLKDFMTTFGAVPVSPFNYHRLLQNKEAILLFPGGVREAYKGKGEEYQLFWPEKKKSEFIRMAARFGATIVPFAGVGIDDSLEVLLDSSELENLPVVGDYVRRQAGRLPQARRGMAAGEEKEKFVAPLAVPRFPPSRLYFVFQKPITLDPSDTKDRERCEELYLEVKRSVEEGISYLREQRKRDPYADFGLRTFYEGIRGGRRQAPTFPLQ